MVVILLTNIDNAMPMGVIHLAMKRIEKKTFVNYLGLLGVVSMLSYVVAMCFAPLAYPGYSWLAQAVSDLSAESAPSRTLWNQLSALYAPCAIVCCTVCCVAVQGHLNKETRLGVYMFSAMNWISAVGFAMFPLTGAGLPSGFQNVMHLVVTALVVLLSIASLVLFIVGSGRNGGIRSLGVWAAIALVSMLIGGLGVNIVPLEYFGLVERFSTLSVVAFTAVLGMYLFAGSLEGEGC